MESVSFFDTEPEPFCHGFMVGLLKGTGCKVLSKREAGLGRPDIKLASKYRTILFELKSAKTKGLITQSNVAENQIINKKYTTGVLAEGAKFVIACSIVFDGKRCVVEYRETPMIVIKTLSWVFIFRLLRL
jgi:hypothetical protein